MLKLGARVIVLRHTFYVDRPLEKQYHSTSNHQLRRRPTYYHNPITNADMKYFCPSSTVTLSF